MPHITTEVLAQTERGIEGLLRDYKDDIEAAYCNDEDPLSLSITVKYGVPKNGNGILIDTSLTFVKEKIKAKTQTIVDPNKDSLFKGLGSELKPGESVTVSSGEKTVTMHG